MIAIETYLKMTQMYNSWSTGLQNQTRGLNASHGLRP